MKDTIALLRQLLPYFPASARRYIGWYTVVSCLLSVLDVAALSLLALSMTAMLAGDPIAIPGLAPIGPAGYVWVILVVSFLIILKSMLTLAQRWFGSRRFASYELEIGRQLFDAYIRTPWVERLSRSTSELVRMVDVGVAAINGGFLMPLLTIPGQLATSVLLLVTLLAVQPATAVLTVVYLGLFAFLLYAVLRKKTIEAGQVNQRYSYRVASLMTDMVGAMKEITLQNKAPEVAKVVVEERRHATRARANLQVIGAAPQFVLDGALIGGFLVIGASAYFFSGGLDAAIAAIAMFAVVGMRLIPSLVMFQTVSNTVDGNKPQVEAVLNDLRDADRYRKLAENVGQQPFDHKPQELVLDDVTFTYPSASEPAVANVNLRIPMGSSVGFVGYSGSGKTTLVDIILGLLVPQEGELRVDGQNMNDVLAAWRSSVGYVPQEVALFDATIAQNVALSWGSDIDLERVEKALKRAQLWDTVMEREGGMQARVGDRGIAFSGGQRQRLGIARALYTDPLVLVMDEATSALDTKTESQVAESINALHGEVTVISVAHRLSTVRHADMICYMEAAHLVATGTFEEVAREVPAFAEQARLAGLLDDGTIDSGQ